jgi:AcrR family transcriptional regulator
MPRTSGPRTRARILTCAARAFGSHGYADTSLDDVSAAAGIRKQSLLYHFPTKEQLFTQCAVLAAQRFVAALEVALRPGPVGLERLDALVGAVHRLSRRRPEVVALIREASRLGPPLSNMVLEAARPTLEAAVAWLQRAMDEGQVRVQDPRVAVLAIYHAVIGYLAESSLRRAVMGESDPARAEAELIAFLRAGLAP